MTHLPEHPHAFVTGGVVTNIAVFAEDDHDGEILDAVQEEGGHDAWVCLCSHGSVPAIGDTWGGTAFTHPEPDPPPSPPTS